MKTNFFLLAAIILFAFTPLQDIFAQGEQRTFQLSGIVVDGEEDYGVPGVSVYIKHANRGVATNDVGFFSLPTVVGDTVIIRAVGYKQQELVVPRSEELGLTILIDLQSDTTLLPVLEFFPYPTKELFEEAFMALGDEKDSRLENMERNLSKEAMERMVMSLSMDGAGNYREYMKLRNQVQDNRLMGAPSNPLLNPFAWAELIKSLRKKKK
ncbi:carboxypeptidase-like regulatory domain-containing protein [Algivirga pacifica]|uniref:CarboxypepD_reg-like domain-containing protein n=1 Tax=Algivirga pacifica TaxID=1162670 RepID=A0ABP9D6F4_9BACT